jgi:hypothetical protein
MKLRCAMTMFGLVFFLVNGLTFAEYSEVLDEPAQEIYIQEHKVTHEPLVTLANEDGLGSRYEFLKNPQKISRPDYIMLDHQLKSGDIPYDGPVSNRKKVYYFAAGMAATGVLAGTLIPVSAVSAGTATTGAGAYAAGGAAVAASSVGLSSWKSKPDLQEENFSHTHEAVLIRLAKK